MLWRNVKAIRKSLATLSLLLTILILPTKVPEAQEAVQNWWWAHAPSRETALIIFSSALVALMFWVELRPSILSHFSTPKIPSRILDRIRKLAIETESSGYSLPSAEKAREMIGEMDILRAELVGIKGGDKLTSQLFDSLRPACCEIIVLESSRHKRKISGISPSKRQLEIDGESDARAREWWSNALKEGHRVLKETAKLMR